MRKYRLIILGTLLLAVSGCQPHIKPETPEEPEETAWWDEGSTIYGTVSCSGAPLEGVIVSDGAVVTVTDAAGHYQMASAKGYGSVFVSVPSGYQAVSDGILPKFYHNCTADAAAAEKADFELVKVDQSHSRVLLFGDIHLASRTFCNDIGQYRGFMAEVSGLAAGSSCPVYGLTLGDMSWDYYWGANNYGLLDYLNETKKGLSGLQLFHTMGNHDNDPSATGDAAGELLYRNVIGPGHYSFNVGGVHFIVLDSMLYLNDPLGQRNFLAKVSDEQISWMVEDIAHVPHKTPIVVAMHTPLYRKDGSSALGNLWDLIKHFEGYDYVQFVTAHMHVIYNVDMLKRSVHVFECNSGAVCGAWWMTADACKSGLQLCSDGSPSGYRILDIDGGAISWKYKATGEDENMQFRAYDRNELCLSAEKWLPNASAEDRKAFLESAGDYARPDSGNEVLINVWDYDPSWTISITENGKTLNVKQLKNVRDPLYLAVYESYEYNHGYSVSYPSSLTDHIFSVTASAPDSSLEIKVTDRFGRMYGCTMSRPQAFVEPK